MRAKKISALLVVSLMLAMPSASAESPVETPASSRPEMLQFLAWNRSGMPIDLEVRLNDEVVFRESVSSSDISSAMNAGTVVQRPAGSYSLQVTDHTRDLTQSAHIDISRGGPNFGVYLMPDQLAIVLSHQSLQKLTPGTLAAPHGE